MAIPSTDAPVSPLRQRMQHDMLMRGLGSHTQQDYVRHVRRFAAFLGRSPDTATPEDIRRFQLDQHENGVGPATINGTVSALRFLFLVTLQRRGCTPDAGGDVTTLQHRLFQRHPPEADIG